MKSEFSTNIFDEPIVKRKMLRRKERLDKEFKERTGETLRKKYRLLQNQSYEKKKIIKTLRDKIRGFKEEKRKALREQEISFNRKLRGRDTRLQNLKAKYDELRKKRGKTVVHKTKKIYKSYDSPTVIRNFETICLEARNSSKTNIEYFEMITKVLEVLGKINEGQERSITITHYLCLLGAFFLKGEIRGIYSTSVEIPTIATSTIRRCFKELADMGYLEKIGKLRYRINLLGEDLIEQVKNKDSFGKSLTLEAIKNASGFRNEEENKENENYDEF